MQDEIDDALRFASGMVLVVGAESGSIRQIQLRRKGGRFNVGRLTDCHSQVRFHQLQSYAIIQGERFHQQQKKGNHS
jgi:hypothetical protein